MIRPYCRWWPLVMGDLRQSGALTRVCLPDKFMPDHETGQGCKVRSHIYGVAMIGDQWKELSGREPIFTRALYREDR